MIGALLLASFALAAAAEPPVERVAFAPRNGVVLPLDARFTDDRGRSLVLGDLLTARPAIVVPAYYGCSNLCGVVLHGVAAALAAGGLRTGRDVEVVAVSIAPLETPADALAKRNTIAGIDDGWHFLTGSDAAINRFTDALSYRYVHVAAEQQYAHASGVAIVAPGGRVVRVLYGASFQGRELADALEAARGTTSSQAASAPPALRTWLLCFHYDPLAGRYTFAAIGAVRAAALAALVALAGYIGYARIRERPR